MVSTQVPQMPEVVRGPAAVCGLHTSQVLLQGLPEEALGERTQG